jgi:hypothetical protein
MSRKSLLARKRLWQTHVSGGSNSIGPHDCSAEFWRKHREPKLKEYQLACKKDAAKRTK